MKQYKYLIVFLVSLALVPSALMAETIRTTQDFQTMAAAKTLTFANSNKTGKTDFVTYSCSGTNSVFALYNSIITIKLQQNGSTVTTTKIKELSELIINFEASQKNERNLKVQVSKDSLSWSPPLSTTDSIVYSSGSMHVTLPRNNYYIRIYNTTGTYPTYITAMDYHQDHCNCFIYQPE
ncbi:MAG: hypothetical protein IJ915_00040 [Paludibacteraceae bacterium]|nr:hypothetical protein [Paludibacteraceae bacterium]